MKIFSLLVFGLIVFTLLGFVSASTTPSVVNINYNDSLGKISYNEVLSSSVLLKVTTPDNTLCQYNSVDENFTFGGGNDFSVSFNNVSQISLTDLSAGVHNYYVKCYSGDMPVTVSLLINPPITGQVVLSESEPLKAGRVDVTLVTSKSVSSVPGLKYSFDGVVYNPLTLVGSGNTWKGYLIIDSKVGEGLVSFKMDATDLEGREGTEITDGAVYSIDTVKPSTVSAIDAEGYNGGITLKWHFNDDSDLDHYNIYRSISPGVTYTDFYTKDTDETFVDNSVTEGQTYYYKVSAVDNAGNEGDLSIEVYATPSSSNETATSSGLALNLRGEVDSLLSEIDFAISEVEGIQSTIQTKTDKEKELFSLMKFDSDVSNAISSLNSLKTTVQNYKLQDLTKDSLDQKIASSEVKIDAIKKKIPEDITILNEGSDKTSSFDESKLREAILEANPSYDETQVSNAAKDSLNLMKERGLIIDSDFYVVRVDYSDGSEKTFSVVKRSLNSQFDKSDAGNFIEVIPKEVIDSASKIIVGNQNYNVVKDDPVLSFGPDAKSIFYSFEGTSDIDSLKGISVNFVSEENSTTDQNPITGYFSLDIVKGKSTWIILALILILCAAGYFFYRRKNSFSDNYFSLSGKIKEVTENLGKNSTGQAEKEYSFIRKNYNALTPSEKNSIYPKVALLQDKILVMKLEAGLSELKVTWDKNLFIRLEKIYNAMTEKSKKRLGKIFMQVKSDIEFKEAEAKGQTNVSDGEASGANEEKKEGSSGEKGENKNEEKENEKK